MEESQEPSPKEKLQLEFQKECTLLGYARSQVMTWEKTVKRHEARIEKIQNRAQNLPQDKIEMKEGESHGSNLNVSSNEYEVIGETGHATQG